MKKIIAFILCTVCFLFSACEISNNQANNSSLKNESEFESGNTSSQNPLDEPSLIIGTDGDIWNSLDLVYTLTENSSMALVEIINITEGFFSDYGDQDHIIVEFKIIKDYYSNISENTIIYVPIYLNELNTSIRQSFKANDNVDSTEKIDYDRIDDSLLSVFLHQYQKAIIFIEKVNKTQTWFKKGNYNDRVQFENITDRILLYNHFFPLGSNDIVLFDEVLSFLDENNCFYDSPYSNIYAFSDFVYKDISLQQMEENIKNLYQLQQSK